ncbi:hypothetical protein M231_02435 [Tremella mesenterica]|uniref:RRM domain-containing protein n=1 Tax=Tremella mesenterica TaxID=5217 RepID=A0A4Q1BQU5_TREME|nr:hypothetical protein M231_02435 [Tremella mesenterica]
MSNFPPFPPSRTTGRYSPSQPYGDTSPYSTSPPSRDAPSYPYAPPPTLPTPPYRPYDAYTPEPRQAYAYEQPRRSFESGGYDPYSPGRPSMRLPPPPPTLLPQVKADTYIPAPIPPRPISPPPKRVPPVVDRRMFPKEGESHELNLITQPTMITIGSYTTAMYMLPPSHLPITKYVTLSRDDALDVHRQMCMRNASVWYADGAARAGEGWSSAVEWIIESSASGSKMRGALDGDDALNAEIGGICKAAEGFQEKLHQSIKDSKPINHELIVFSSSQAAIVAVDTGSRSESLRFERIWREICSEFLQAKMTLVWLPKNPQLEGQVLASKIAFVAASNSYLKRKKEGLLPEAFRRAGAGEPAPGGSSEAGPWQRGDADPSRVKLPFERPKPLLISPILAPVSKSSPVTNGLKLDITDHGGRDSRSSSVKAPPLSSPETTLPVTETDEEGMQVKEGSVFVTRFPSEVSAKDLGILFSQFGNIVAVDIYHVSADLPRFAYVAYSEDEAGPSAISALHEKPVQLDTDFGRANYADLAVWRDWSGNLVVVKAEPPRLVPASVAESFPDLPDWVKGDKNGVAGAQTEGRHMEEVHKIEDVQRKRSRELEEPGQVEPSSPVSRVRSPSPKRPRQSSATEPQAEQEVSIKVEPKTDLTTSPILHTPAQSRDEQTYREEVKPDRRPTPPPTSTFALPPRPVDPQAMNRSFPMPPTPSTAVVERSNNVSHSPLPHTPASINSQPPQPQSQSSAPVRSSSATPSAGRTPNLSQTQSQVDSQGSASNKLPLTNSAAEPIDTPVQIGTQTLRLLLHLVRDVLPKHDPSNWIAHSCLVATEIDTARRGLQKDLYATDEAFLSGREFERVLATRGFTPARVDTFIKKVLGVLDGIAMAEEGEIDGNVLNDDVETLEKELEVELSKYSEQTKEAIMSGGKVMEYLNKGKELQEKKRLEIERRVKVLEGMSKIGDTVSAVVRFLLTEDK